MSNEGEKALLQQRANVLIKILPESPLCRRVVHSMRWALKHINDMEAEIAALHRRIAELLKGENP